MCRKNGGIFKLKANLSIEYLVRSSSPLCGGHPRLLVVMSVLLIFLVFFVKSVLFIFLRPVSCAANVANVSRLYIFDCLFGFL